MPLRNRMKTRKPKETLIQPSIVRPVPAPTLRLGEAGIEQVGVCVIELEKLVPLRREQRSPAWKQRAVKRGIPADAIEFTFLAFHQETNPAGEGVPDVWAWDKVVMAAKKVTNAGYQSSHLQRLADVFMLSFRFWD